ncbi:MAG TPA: Hpt domain-containing protein, partial [Chloroflexota bacterium]
DRARLAAVAHGLGGSAGALGLNQLSSCCQELERLAPDGGPRRAAELVREINRAFERARTVLEHMCEPPAPGP